MVCSQVAMTLKVDVQTFWRYPALRDLVRQKKIRKNFELRDKTIASRLLKN